MLSGVTIASVSPQAIGYALNVLRILWSNASIFGGFRLARLLYSLSDVGILTAKVRAHASALPVAPPAGQPGALHLLAHNMVEYPDSSVRWIKTKGVSIGLLEEIPHISFCLPMRESAFLEKPSLRSLTIHADEVSPFPKTALDNTTVITTGKTSPVTDVIGTNNQC